MNIPDALEKLGLTKREAHIYLHLLQTGPSSPTDVANITGIKRPNVYDVTKTLEQRGLIHYQLINRKKLLVAESPSKIKEIPKQQLALANSLIPLLSNLNTEKGFQSKITFYEGKRAMQNLFNHGLTSKSKEIWYIWSPKDMDKILDKKVVEDFIKQRLKKGIKIRSLRPAEKESFYKAEWDTAYGRAMTEHAYVPVEYTFSLSLAIYDNKTAFYSSQKESFGFLVESREFALVMRMFYSNLWDHSAKLLRRQ